MLVRDCVCGGLQVIEGRDQVDWKRHGVFVTFGFFYLVRFIPVSLEQGGMIMSAT
jgi:hypothetical protein